jgi:N-acetylneuraminic acid mutarotase
MNGDESFTGIYELDDGFIFAGGQESPIFDTVYVAKTFIGFVMKHKINKDFNNLIKDYFSSDIKKSNFNIKITSYDQAL